MALSFVEKNRLLVKHKNSEYFYKDLELFKKHYSGHKLNNELANMTTFSKERLSEQMLLLLLDKVSIEEILENRGIKPPKELTYEEKVSKVIEKYGSEYVIKNTDELKDIATILGQPEPESLGTYASVVGKSIQELIFGVEEDDEDDHHELDEDNTNLESQDNKEELSQVQDPISENEENHSGTESENQSLTGINDELNNDNSASDQDQLSDNTEVTEIESVEETKPEGIEKPESVVEKEVSSDKKKGTKAKNSQK
jgi:hypothetical protein